MTLTLLVWGSQTKTNMAAGVNNLSPFSLDGQNKYGRRAHLLKRNLNTSYFQDGY